MEIFRHGFPYSFLLVALLLQRPDLCAPLRDKDWVEGSLDPFSGFGVEGCDVGTIVDLKTELASSRRVLQESKKHKGHSLPLLPQASPEHKGHNRLHWIIFASVLCGFLLLLSLSLIYIIYFRRNKVISVMPWKTGLSGQLQKAFVTGLPSLKRSEIEVACEDFSNVIGSLSDCLLYKGTLSSGVEIAVTSTMVTSKKDWSDKYEAQFKNKILMLSKVNHKNFMNLIGYCAEKKPFTRMMVYEYAPNGTLFEHLHIKEADHLDWAARLRIIMGIGYCLNHLHNLDPPVLLRNLDSSSIYLCDDYAAKLSDLPFWNGEEPRDSNVAAGTADIIHDNVYKFGIVLLEIVSGRLPLSKDDDLLVLWASSHLNGKRPLMGMVDPTLESYGDRDVSALCNVIRSCIDSDAKRRPGMAEVVGRLREITGIGPGEAVPRASPLWWAELEIISAESGSLM